MKQIGSSIRTNWCEAGDTPAAVIDSGDVIAVDSSSFTEGYTIDTMHKLDLKLAVTPLTAPIIVKGAASGSTLRIDVLDLQFLRDFGCVLLLPGRGAFPDVTDELVAHPVGIDDHQVQFTPGLTIPTRKMLGKLSVAPQGERILSNEPGLHGGNMDNRDIGVGASVYLPVNVEGAHLGIGDAHAIQGDGECGISAVEVEMRSIIRVTVCDHLDIRTPVIRSGGHVMTMGVGPTLDAAAAQALEEMRRLVRRHLGLDAKQATMFMSLTCDVHVSQLVNPLMSVKCKISDQYLALP